MKTKLLLLLLLANFSIYAQYTVIPDINFENKLIALGIDSGAADGKVLTSNISTITSLDVSNSNISNLSGIEDFVSLTKLDCGTNKLLTLNVSNNKLLTDLNCRYNNLSVLDLSANLKLTALDCIYNQITSLDVTKMLNLGSLLCTANQLTSLDVTNNLALYWFGCNGNKLITLDVSKNKLLQYLDCGFNQLTALDVSNNTALFYLNCYYNKLTALDISMLTELTDLACSDSKLSKLDVSKNTKLKSLLCEKMTFTTLDISNNTALKELYCGNGKLTTLNVSKNKALTILQCFNNQLSDLNIKNGTNTLLTTVNFIQNPDLICIQVDDVTYSNKNWSSAKDITANYSTNCNTYTLIPDSNFENKLISLGIDTGVSDGKVLTSSINKLTFLNVSGAKISSLEGIDGFSALTNLICSGNQLTSLDLSNNYALQILDSSNNRLTELYTSKSNNLVALTCENNLLSTLDIINNTALDLLDFSGNQLSSIDLSQHKALSQLFCASNQLTKLDLSKNILLKDLNCSSNQLISLNLKNGNNTNLHSFNIHLENNPNLSCIQVDNKTYSDTNWLNFKDVTATYNEDCDYYTLIAEPNFEQKLIDLGIDTDGLNGRITTANISTITSLDLSNSNIKDLSGIENFTALTFLDCSDNQLTTLDVSKNLALETLNAGSNQITTLDLSKNSKLKIVYVTNNPLISLNLQNGNNRNFVLPSATDKKTAALYTSFLGLTTLSCIKVDDVNYSNANWSKIKEPTAIYSATCSTLGIEDSGFNKAVLYPNPTKGEVNINNIALEKATVYNSLGQLVKTFTLNSSNTNNTINLSGLPKGVYYVYLINQNAASAKKIIVE
ncbi:hypothetical protein ASF10_00840 [Flavobacterium sp. Leaf82]|uniref:leucine-rich repeat domain-containing protein n=1 Tax=unclassified Flavobacterium TaxID=196869 RepID=UPI0006F5F8B4|nr:leucine-rich repeat domain-containing protein [Flavobacterium sp. Leaf82]KQO34299.1 hypothetical protein ASF10_00840 [Flavobacterium sp. Leaf82]